MGKATVAAQQPPVQVPKRPHLVALPSGRVIEFGNVIDCYETDENPLVLVQQTATANRLIELDVDDAAAALHVMRGLALVVLGKRPTTLPIDIIPASALPRKGD
ncbi:MAG TPA: hypothetical protein VEA69_16755 [Tepidisphaeraceae bacterium]|nr:hypothetical protein [Tepidisphaeraceae bacterium]